MDAAAKPPGMGSRRPPRTHRPQPNQGFPRSTVHPRGAAPFAGTYFAGDNHMSITALNTSVPARSRTLTVTGSA